MCRSDKLVMLIATEKVCRAEPTFVMPGKNKKGVARRIQVQSRSCVQVVIYLFSFFQPQLRNRRRMQSRTLIPQSSHQVTLLAHRRFPQQQDLYRIKTAPQHIWTRAKTVVGLLWPNVANTTNQQHPARLFFVFRLMLFLTARVTAMILILKPLGHFRFPCSHLPQV